MTIDLGRLREMHPLLPEHTAQEHVHRAALALQRRHEPGVRLELVLDGGGSEAELRWPAYANDDAEQLDDHRVTEDGAEAVALAVVHAHHGWTVLRRLQRGDYADWLLAVPGTQKRVALEVSGTDDGDDSARMREKLVQVLRCRAGSRRAACVVRFVEPRCSLNLVLEVFR